MKKFNLSPSSLNLWDESQLSFFYKYLTDEMPDTQVVQCYGLAGTLVHDCLELYAEFYDREFVLKCFRYLWSARGLLDLFDLRGRLLSEEHYRLAVVIGMSLIDSKYEVLKTELELIFPLTSDINKKGFIDVVARKDNKLVLVDWKTSSRVKKDDSFRRQLLFYAHMYYCSTEKLINKCVLEYVKIGETVTYEFTDGEIIMFERDVLQPILKLILSKGTDVKKYNPGKWDNIFNEHKLKCKARVEERDKVLERMINVS